MARVVVQLLGYRFAGGIALTKLIRRYTGWGLKAGFDAACGIIEGRAIEIDVAEGDVAAFISDCAELGANCRAWRADSILSQSLRDPTANQPRTPTMPQPLPTADNRVLETPWGQALGSSFRWSGGQYCAIHTDRGLIGCGIYNPHVAGEFGQAVAIAKGTPSKPLCEPEDLYEAKIVELSEPAAKLGIQLGMTGMQALEKLLQ